MHPDMKETKESDIQWTAELAHFSKTLVDGQVCVVWYVLGRWMVGVATADGGSLHTKGGFKTKRQAKRYAIKVARSHRKAHTAS